MSYSYWISLSSQDPESPDNRASARSGLIILKGALYGIIKGLQLQLLKVYTCFQKGTTRVMHGLALLRGEVHWYWYFYYRWSMSRLQNEGSDRWPTRF